MNKLLKNALAILVLFVFVISLASCATEEDEQESSGTPSVTENVIYSPEVKTVVVLGEGVTEKEVAPISSAYYNKVGKEISVVSSAAEKSEHEIVVGKTDRAISQRAYRLLSLMNYNEGEVGYLIYSDGNSVALAFEDAIYGVEAAFTKAVESFSELYMQGSVLELNEGVVYKTSFDAVEWQTERDEDTLNLLWDLKSSQLLTKLSGDEALTEDILSKLKSIYETYNSESIVVWLVNLYDPETGGFYYSNSARNNIGFLPDLESTAQALGIVKSILNGYSGTITDYFGEEVASRFVEFAKAMQASDNGYFYHPQWERELVDKNYSRRTRDMLNALDILESFGASPTYNTPNGVEGDGIAVAASAVGLTLPLSKSRVIAVSDIAESGEDEIYIPSHMATKESFESYLSSLKIHSNTAEVCEELVSYVSLMRIRDEMLEELGESYSLIDICVDWLKKNQSYSTGFWSQSSSLTYDNITELFSVINLYNALQKSLPNAKKIVSSLTEMMDFENDIREISDISNAWATLSAFKTNLSLYTGTNDEQAAKDTLAIMYSSIPGILSATNEKISLYRNADGSFSTLENGGTGYSGGMPIAIAGLEEGDVSATLTAVKTTWLSIFNVLGISSVPIFNTSDRMLFQKSLLDIGVIIKNEIIESEPIDFEDEEVGNTVTTAKVTQNQSSSAIITKYSEERGNVLNIKSSYSGWEYIEFPIQQKTTGATCNILEIDMCVLPETSEGYFAQISLYKEMYMIGINRVGDKVMLYEESSISASSSCSHDLGVSADVGEWFNLRVEYYVGTRETVRIKIFFNEECIAVTDNFYSPSKISDASVEPLSNYTMLRIAKTPKDLKMDLLVDNIICEQNYKTYTPETNENTAIKRNIDAPDSNQVVHSFETVTNGYLPSGFELSGAQTVSVAEDSELGKYLSFGSGGAKLTVPLHHRGSASNSANVSFSLNVDESSEVGAKYEISFDEYMYKNRSLVAIHFIVAEDNGTKYLTLAEGLAGKTGTEYTHIKLPLGETVNVKLRFFFNEGTLLVFINDELMGVNGSTLGGQPRFYMGAVTMTNLTSSVSSVFRLDNVVCERIRGDFEAESTPDIDRYTYTFDSLDGIESSGVSADGAVSFENASAGGSIKVPVNARSVAASLYYVSLDIEKTLSQTSDILISMQDKDGNILASFAIEATNTGIALYEYTDNGKYKTPIGAVTGDSLKLIIEYSPTKESFNIYNGEEYIASTSVTYSLDSYDTAFEYLAVKSLAQSGFKIDNLVAEITSAIFKSPSVTSSNKDDGASVITYENSSLYSIPKNFNKEFSSGTSMLRVKEGVIKNSVSRVLEFHSTKAGSDALIMKQTASASNANAIAFESDMMLRAEDGKLQLSITLRTAGTNNSAVMLYLNVNPGEYMTVISSKGEYSVTTNVKDGEWFKLRYEYAKTEYDYNYDGVFEDVIVRVYINDTLVATGDKTVNTTVYDELQIDNVRFIVGNNIQGRVYFDNSKLEQCTISYDPPYPADTHTLTYEPGVVTKMTKATLGKGSALSIAEMNVENQVSKVLNLLSAASAEDKLDITLTQTLEGANAFKFETDLNVSPVTDTLSFSLDLLNAAEKSPFTLTVTAAKDGDVTLSGAGIAETVIGKSGEWIHLKIEYMNPELDYTEDGKRDIIVRVYTENSNTPLVTGYKPNSINSHYNPTTLEKARLKVTKAHSGNIYLDNTMLWQVSLTPDEGGKAPSEDNVVIGGSTYDKDGWD